MSRKLAPQSPRENDEGKNQRENDEGTTIEEIARMIESNPHAYFLLFVEWAEDVDEIIETIPNGLILLSTEQIVNYY